MRAIWLQKNSNISLNENTCYYIMSQWAVVRPFSVPILILRLRQTMLGGSLITTSWHVLMLQMDGSCKYIE